MWRAPQILSLKREKNKSNNFPVDHYSYSSFTKFSTNPFMFKVNYMNGDRIETTSSAASVLGSACHKAMQAYLGGNPEFPTPADEGEAIKLGHSVGLEYLKNYSDGFIDWSATIPNRAKLDERFAFAYFGYIKESNYKKEIKETLIVEKMLKHQVQVDGKILPVPLKGYPDLVFRDHEGRVCIDDHKFTSKYSDEDKIDGEKLIQAVILAFLVAAELGEFPYKIRFREFKTVPNQNKSPQTRPFEIVYQDTPLAFEFFYRFYHDITDALLGKQVFVPNIKTLYDNEVSILAYIHRLDVDEERARVFKELKVDNITDFLKLKIQKDGSMKKYMDTVVQKFVSATTLNYKTMTIPEKIKMKLAEHGLGVEFVDKIEGATVSLYRFDPSIGLKMSKIEAYAKDIEQVVEVSGIRIIAPMPNSGFIGFEIPNHERKFPVLPEANTGFRLAIGQTIMGDIKYFDVREAPHVLVAGATGAGKSVLLSSLIVQLNRLPKKQVDIHLYDPKIVELVVHKDDKNVVEYKSDPVAIQKSLSGMVKLMNDRYKLLAKAKVRNIEDNNATAGNPFMAYKFLVIDEFGDLVLQTKEGFFEWEFCAAHKKLDEKNDGELTYLLTTKKSLRKHETELIETVFNCEKGCKKHTYAPMSEIILQIAQKGRACGIHLIIATQRPSVDIITGSIKANFPTKMALRTSKTIDSQIIIDDEGAEKLLGKGDMLFSSVDGVERLQGYFVK